MPTAQLETAVNDEVRNVLVPFIAKWICDASNHGDLAKAICSAQIKYHQERDNRGGDKLPIQNEGVLSDAFALINNAAVTTVRTISSFFPRNPLSQSPCTKGNAKQFFLKLDSDEGWKAEGHTAGLGLMSFNTGVMIEVWESVKQSLLERYNLEEEEAKNASRVFNKVDSMQLMKNKAHTLYDNISGAILDRENKLSSSPHSSP